MIQHNANNTNNLAGSISADTLRLNATNDLSISSTTQTSTGNVGQRTAIDRVAGLYVSGPLAPPPLGIPTNRRPFRSSAPS